MAQGWGILVPVRVGAHGQWGEQGAPVIEGRWFPKLHQAFAHIGLSLTRGRRRKWRGVRPKPFHNTQTVTAHIVPVPQPIGRVGAAQAVQDDLGVLERQAAAILRRHLHRQDDDAAVENVEVHAVDGQFIGPLRFLVRGDRGHPHPLHVGAVVQAHGMAGLRVGPGKQETLNEGVEIDHLGIGVV